MRSPASIFQPAPRAFDLPPLLQNVMAVGGLGITFGVLGLCALPLVAEPVTSEYLGRGGVIADHGLINTWGLISADLGCGLATAALIGGMGCLRFKSWARPVMLGFGIISVILGLIGIYFHVLILRAAWGAGGVPEVAMRVSALAEWVAWVVGTIFGAWVLRVLTRPGVKAAFADEKVPASPAPPRPPNSTTGHPE